MSLIEKSTFCLYENVLDCKIRFVCMINLYLPDIIEMPSPCLSDLRQHKKGVEFLNGSMSRTCLKKTMRERERERWHGPHC